MNRGAGWVPGGIAAAACLLLAAPAGAATLVGDYQLQGSLASSGPGPALTDVGSGNSFQSDTVMGTSRQVLTFPEGNGLQMNPTGLPNPGQYSEVLTFRFATVAPNYYRVLDSLAGGGAVDSGLYVRDGRLDFYDQSSSTDFESTSVDFPSYTYATAAMVMVGFPTGTKIYLNCAPVATFPGDYNLGSDILRFFKDNGGEESAGAVSCIRVFSGALTDAEVAAIGASQTCAPPASPAPHKKKCKKKKKKHRAAEAKKKCKKKRKR
jgi:hypothetical protein